MSGTDECTQTDYEKYKAKIRQHPEAIILVRTGGDRLVTFENDAILVAQRLKKSLCMVDRHRSVWLRREDLDNLPKPWREPLAFA